MTKTIGLKPVGDDPKPQIWGEMFSGMLPTKPQRLQIGIAQTERSPLRSMQRQMDLESSFQWMRSRELRSGGNGGAARGLKQTKDVVALGPPSA